MRLVKSTVREKRPWERGDKEPEVERQPEVIQQRPEQKCFQKLLFQPPPLIFLAMECAKMTAGGVVESLFAIFHAEKVQIKKQVNQIVQFKLKIGYCVEPLYKVYMSTGTRSAVVL